jgi:hypothetical protein
VAQLLGAAAATALFRWLVPRLPATAPDVVHSGRGVLLEDGVRKVDPENPAGS